METPVALICAGNETSCLKCQAKHVFLCSSLRITNMRRRRFKVIKKPARKKGIGGRNKQEMSKEKKIMAGMRGVMQGAEKQVGENCDISEPGKL